MIRSVLILILLLTGLNGYAQFITNNGIAITNTALVTTNGSWTSDAGTTLVNNGTIRVSESFVNNGTLDPAGKGGFILQFASDMNFRAGGMRMGFLVKEGAGVALVTGTVSVNDSLLLKNGLLRLLSATDTVSARAGALVSSNASSYVEGLVSRAGTGDLVFPVGRNGLYLPLKLYRAQVQKATVSLVNAPAGYTAGPGLDSLINFPYAWKVYEKVKADTAAYIEVDYPNSLPIGANPIVVREIAGQKYASMGARSTSNASGRVIVRSYTKGLTGMFTVANGFPVDLKTDSLALVALYHATGGPSWTAKNNWLSGDLETWSGITVNGQSITALSLPANKLTGAVPDALVDIDALQTINLSGNSITSIPDFTLNDQITSLNVSGNRLNFASLEPNAAVPGINYGDQAELGAPVESLVAAGTPVQFSADAGGTRTQYQWKRNGQAVAGANAPVYALASIGRTNMGEYVAEATNPLVPGLTLKSAVQRTLACANLSGRLMAEQSQAAAKGSLTLFRVMPTAYDTIGSVQVQEDGSYAFEKVVLDDYQLLGFADTLTYSRALPTYYKNTIFWEEADTLSVENDISDLNIISVLEPAPALGRGSISGYLEEDDGTGRLSKIQRARRVSGAGVSVRRVENTGRGKAEILTLVAYVFTDENGEFVLPNLPTGEYRLNIQYPGYPMDESSFITIPIGTALQSQVSVEAMVQNGKINVRKRVITGVAETGNYAVQVYPNPAVDFIHLRFEGAAERMISLTDLHGRAVVSTGAQEAEAVVNVQRAGKGIYLLVVKEEGVVVRTFKVSIE
jgi:hypothetical protein